MSPPKIIEREAIAIIAILGSDILLVRHRKRGGSTEIPGGALLPGESVFNGAKRKLFEECGLRVDPEYLSWPHTKVVHGWRVYVVRAWRWSGELALGRDENGANDCFFGDPALLLTGMSPEDHETVMREMYGHAEEAKDHVTIRQHWEALSRDVQAAITHRIGKGLAGCAPALASCPPSALLYLERAAKAALAVEPKEQSDEIAALRVKVAELDVIVREFASTSHLLDLGEVAFVCPFCRTDLDGKLSGHDDDCVWLLARKTLGMDC